MDLYIYIGIAIATCIFFYVRGPLYTRFTHVEDKPKHKSHNASFPGAWKKGANFTYDKGFKEYLAKGGNPGTWGTKAQTKFSKPKRK